MSRDVLSKEFLERQIEEYTALIESHEKTNTRRAVNRGAGRQQGTKRRRAVPSHRSLVASSTPTGLVVFINGAKYISRDGGETYRRVAKLGKSSHEEKKIYCTFFIRTGKCRDGDKCTFVHDASKVAICRASLAGGCTDPECTLSHRKDQLDNRMPVCSFFLRGVCTNEDCPFSHVFVNPSANVCPDFLKGYCPAGVECKLKHTDVCQAFSRQGTCPDGPACKLRHVDKKGKHPSKPSSSAPSTGSIKPSFVKTTRRSHET